MGLTIPVGVLLDNPILTRREVDLCLRDRFRTSQGSYRRWDDKAKDEVAFRFFSSQEYLGPLSAPVFAGWCARELKILTKDGRIVPFVVNAIQYRFLEELFDDINDGTPARYIILKARQFGFSTLVQAICFFFTATEEGCSATVISHKDSSTAHLYGMFKRFCDHARLLPRRVKANRRQLAWAHDSKISLETAGGKEAGRSTTNRIVHASELAFWDNADPTWLALAQTVGDYPNTMVFQESTANGMGDLFHRNYQAGKQGKSRYKSLFYAWWEHPEYRIKLTRRRASQVMQKLDDEEMSGIEQFGWDAEQVAWRRFTIHDKCGGDVTYFHQEYPSTDDEAFLTSGSPVFDPEQVAVRLRRASDLEPLVVGNIGYSGRDV